MVEKPTLRIPTNAQIEVIVRYAGQEWTVADGRVVEVNINREIEHRRYPDHPYPTGRETLTIVLNRTMMPRGRMIP